MTQQQQKQQYFKNYQQFNLLGRGAYGSAFLVKNKIDGHFYVSKKMMLQGMGEKQIASAWGEIEILKKFNDLNIPFIVEYKESYHFQSTLIIVMEYCQHGDLATFLKNWKRKGQLLDEKVIINWFIQLVFGVKALHSKNVLHRDLKSANVFLTSNKTLKIGDFGISKVLDNTSAKTFVGTPYYLSPQVCQSRPYSLASDLWALGIILYEMCTLNYPFQGSNLVALAVKITTQKVKPIPEKYSPQLNNIVMKLFTKDQKHRMTIDQILKLPFIKKHMATFVEDQQKINQLIQVGIKQFRPQQQQQQAEQKKPQKTINTNNSLDDNEQTMKTINSVMQRTSGSDTLNYSQSLSFKQRQQLKKAQQNRRNQQAHMQALKQNSKLHSFAKQKKQQVLATSGSNFNKSMNLQRQIQNQNKRKADFARTKKGLQKIQAINAQQLSTTINQVIKNMKATNTQYEEVDIPEGLQTIKKSINNISIDDNRPIKPSKNQSYVIPEQQYYIQEQLQQYYDEGFQDYIEEEPQMKSTATREQFQQIKAFYEHQAGHGSISPSKKSKIAQAFKSEQINAPLNPKKKVTALIEECKDLLGQKKYNDLYKRVKNGQIQYKNIKSNFNQNEIKVIKIIDEIIYYENF